MNGLTSTIILKADLENQLAALRTITIKSSSRMEQTPENQASVTGALEMLDTLAAMNGIVLPRVVNASDVWQWRDPQSFEIIGGAGSRAAQAARIRDNSA